MIEAEEEKIDANTTRTSRQDEEFSVVSPVGCSQHW